MVIDSGSVTSLSYQALKSAYPESFELHLSVQEVKISASSFTCIKPQFSAALALFK